jgi:lipopolysaccharide export system protein LptC
MDARNLLSVAGVLLALGGIGYYWGLGRPELSLTSADSQRRPDYEVKGIRLTESGKDGKLLRRLDSPGLRHYTTPQDEAELDSPVLRLYDNGREVWRLQASQGSSLFNGREVRLQGGVTAERVDPAAVPLRFVTPALTAWPEEERLQSTSGIRLTSPQGELSGQSLQASLKTGSIDINQNVTGVYAPTRR